MHELMRTNKVDELVSFSRSCCLSDEQARNYELELITDPNNLELRAKLVGHYSSLADQSTSSTQLNQHIAWFVENCPETAVACECSQKLEPIDNPNLYALLDELWRKKMRANPMNFDIVFNAVVFYESMGRSDEALTFAKKARKIRQDNLLEKKIRYLKDMASPAGDWHEFKKQELERLTDEAK